VIFLARKEDVLNQIIVLVMMVGVEILVLLPVLLAHGDRDAHIIVIVSILEDVMLLQDSVSVLQVFF
jgi:hypothetical protein